MDVSTAEALVKNDPPVAFVAIAVAAARNPENRITVKVPGQTLVLPAWTRVEWAWYLGLALGIARAQQVASLGAMSRLKLKLAVDVAKKRAALLSGGALGKPSDDDAFSAYDSAVRLVLASNASSVGESRGAMAWEAFKFGLANVPQTVISTLGGAGASVAKEAGRVVGSVFSGLASGSGFEFGSLGLIAAGIGAIYLLTRKGE